MILVTGASGFVGRHLINELIAQRGVENVIAYTSKPIPGVRCVVHQEYDTPSMQFADMGFGGIGTVIYAGAGTPKNTSQASDAAMATRNVDVLRRFLEGQMPQLQRFLFLSTLDVYGPVPITDEMTPLAPSGLYGKSKLDSEGIVTEWARTRGVTAQVLRLGHVYGPGEEQYQKMIPATFRKILRGEAIELFGEGRERRAFIYVADAVKAIAKAMTLDANVGAINIASSQNISIADLVQLMIDITNAKVPVVHRPVTMPGRDMIFDTAKLQRYLLSAETPLRDGLLQEWAYMKTLAL